MSVLAAHALPTAAARRRTAAIWLPPSSPLPEKLKMVESLNYNMLVFSLPAAVVGSEYRLDDGENIVSAPLPACLPARLRRGLARAASGRVMARGSSPHPPP